jgi:hypothetical protein
MLRGCRRAPDQIAYRRFATFAQMTTGLLFTQPGKAALEIVSLLD